jgi:hypothetical protein
MAAVAQITLSIRLSGYFRYAPRARTYEAFIEVVHPPRPSCFIDFASFPCRQGELICYAFSPASLLRLPFRREYSPPIPALKATECGYTGTT